MLPAFTSNLRRLGPLLDVAVGVLELWEHPFARRLGSRLQALRESGLGLSGPTAEQDEGVLHDLFREPNCALFSETLPRTPLRSIASSIRQKPDRLP